MERPLISEMDRLITRKYPDSLTASAYNMEIAKSHFKRDFDKSWLIQKFIKPIVEWLAKILQ